MFKEPILQDQVAIVTGGGTGLGLEIARQYALHGARIAIGSRKPDNLAAGKAALEESGAEVFTHAMDVREPASIRAFLTAVLERFGRVDILVNNAAGNFLYPAEKLPLRAWRSVIDIVLNGSFYCSQIIGQHMIERGSGLQLNILATYAWTGGPGTIHSASAKAGVLAMTRTLAVEWARYGVRVNAIAPGPFDTQGASTRLWPTDEMEKAVAERIPLKRFAGTEEVARAALYLASPYAGYITGECLTIDGGGWLGRGIGDAVDLLDDFDSLRTASKKARIRGAGDLPAGSDQSE